MTNSCEGKCKDGSNCLQYEAFKYRPFCVIHGKGLSEAERNTAWHARDARYTEQYAIKQQKREEELENIRALPELVRAARAVIRDLDPIVKLADLEKALESYANIERGAL